MGDRLKGKDPKFFAKEKKGNKEETNTKSGEITELGMPWDSEDYRIRK